MGVINELGARQQTETNVLQKAYVCFSFLNQF